MNRSLTLRPAISAVLGGTLALGLAACGGSAPSTPSATSVPRATTAAAPKEPTVAPVSAVSPNCRSVLRGWTTRPADGGTAMSTAALHLTRAGRHACYDRIVLDINGSAATGFVVRYVTVVTSDGKGDPVPVPGRADLQVIVRAPITDDAGHQPSLPALRVGDEMIAAKKLAGFPSVTAVRFAGSFEGQTTIAVGVQQRRPFRVWEYGDQHHRHVVVDVAH